MTAGPAGGRSLGDDAPAAMRARSNVKGGDELGGNGAVCACAIVAQDATASRAAMTRCMNESS